MDSNTMGVGDERGGGGASHFFSAHSSRVATEHICKKPAAAYGVMGSLRAAYRARGASPEELDGGIPSSIKTTGKQNFKGNWIL